MTERRLWGPLLAAGGSRPLCIARGKAKSRDDFRARCGGLGRLIGVDGRRAWVVYDEDPFDFLCALLAVMATGCEARIPANGQERSIRSLCTDSVGFVGHHGHLAADVDTHASLTSGPDPGNNEEILFPASEWGDAVFCTSGSTGEPKQVRKSASQLWMEAESFRNKWDFSPGSVFLPLVPHQHIYGLAFGYLLPLQAEAAFYTPGSEGILGVVEPLEGVADCTSIVVVTSPTLGRQANRIPLLADDLSVAGSACPVPVARVFCAGGPLSDDEAKSMETLLTCPVTEIFGSTETGAVATRGRGVEGGAKLPWTLLPGLEAMVEDEGDVTVGSTPGTGALLVRGGHVSQNGAPAVATGDRARICNSGEFQLLGRSDDLLKVEGKRVSGEQVAALLRESGLVNSAVVLANRAGGRESLSCGVVLSDSGLAHYREQGKMATDALMRQRLRQHLDPVLVPKRIRYLDSLPVNALGKVPKQELEVLVLGDQAPTLPVLQSDETGTDGFRLRLTIPVNLACLKGHFERRPIVPGFMLLHWVHLFTPERTGCLLDTAAINRLKFTRPIRPGDSIVLDCRVVGEGLEFAYMDDKGGRVASGHVPLIADRPGAGDV